MAEIQVLLVLITYAMLTYVPTQKLKNSVLNVLTLQMAEMQAFWLV